MPDPVHKTQTQKRLRLHTAAILYFLSRLVLVSFVFSVPAIYFLVGRVEVPVVAGGAGLVAVLLISYYLAAAGLRCAACGSPVLMDNGCRKHPGARRLLGLSNRARVAWDILLRTNYQCMYCHTRCQCKKGGSDTNSVLGAGRDRRTSAGMADGESFPFSPFSGVEGLTEEVFGDEPTPADGQNLLFGESPRVESAPPAFAPPPGTAAMPVGIAAMPSLEQTQAPPVPEAGAPRPLSPVPWTVPLPAKTPDKETAMNRPSTEPHQSTQAPNPFLAAAAAMPPPPGPVLPPIHKSVPVQVDLRPAEPPPFRQEFPISAAETPDSDIPTPWTLPFMPVPSAPASPAMVLPAPPAAVRAPAVAPDAALPSGLVKDVLRALEEGRRALTETFQSLIGKLEATLTAPPPVPIAVLQPPAPPVEPAGEPVISHAVELPSLLASPEPAAPPRERTTHVPLPPVIAAMPLPVLPPAPVTKPIPAPTGPEESAPAAPRRKFAKPSGLAAQQLSTALHQVFETPPPASNGNGYPGNGAPPAPLPPRTPLADSPFHAMPAMPAPPPALRTQAPVPDSVYSPFAVSSAPLSSPDGRPDEPVPFTLLMNKGAQFEPAPVSAPVGLYDPLDDTALPWMQPLSGPAPRH